MKSTIKLLGIFTVIVSCNTVKPYERVNINDNEMQLSAKKNRKT